jgi:hypothetical protein
MTKVDSAAAADGSSSWFKINETGPAFTGRYATWKYVDAYSTTIPSCLAPGEYLVRIEHLGLFGLVTKVAPQFYVSCAQVKVTGSGSKTFSGVKIPGHVSATDPGLNVYDLNAPEFKNYTIPGPAVSTC